MTFTELQNEVANRLNLTGDSTLARIGRSINERYDWVMTSIGLVAVVRTTAIANTIIGTRSLTFGPTPVSVEKILGVYNAATTPYTYLKEKSFDEVKRQTFSGTTVSKSYAIQNMSTSSVTIYLDSVPESIYTLSADVQSNVSELHGELEPLFARSFHNVLVYGSMATELEKMEKYPASAVQEQKFQSRLSDLRMFIAKSASLDIYQGKKKRALFTNNRNED